MRYSTVKKGMLTLSTAFVMAAGMVTNTFAATNIVSPSNLMGWTDGSGNGGMATFVDGAPVGFGSGSLQLMTDGTNPARATFSHDVNRPLSDVTTLGYYAKQVAASSEGGTASMFVSLDLNNDGVWDTNLIYEPYWQNDGSPDAAPVLANQWQQWDAGSGLFWSTRTYAGALNLVAGAGGPPFYTLSDIKAAYPDAQVMAFGVNVGTYNPGYTILVDGVMLNDTVYDFEKVAPMAVPGSKDDCKQSGWMDLVRTDGSSFKNQGQCVSYVQSSPNSKQHR